MNNHITEELLVKYLLGEANSAEQEQVQNWIGKSEENRKEYYRFKTIWEESKHLATGSTVDENAAWERFKARTEKQPVRTIPLPGRYNWVKVAAVLLVLAGGGVLAYNNYFKDEETTYMAAGNVTAEPVNMKMPEAPVQENTLPTPETAEVTSQGSGSQKTASVSYKNEQVETKPANNKKFIDVTYEPPLHSSGRSHHSRRSVCNATPCPLEICIIQKVQCPGDNETSAISTCSVLEPDESGQLHYKSFDHITKNCNTDIEEIRIRRVSTGETIVLNASSKPATARDFFNYINGEKKGDILAGMFHKDCNNHADDCGLIFNNDYGIIMQ